jgi:hypothetical protein
MAIMEFTNYYWKLRDLVWILKEKLFLSEFCLLTIDEYFLQMWLAVYGVLKEFRVISAFISSVGYRL